MSERKWMASWSLSSREDDEITVQPTITDDRLDITVTDIVAESEGCILLDKQQATALRDVLTHFIENMP